MNQDSTAQIPTTPDGFKSLILSKYPNGVASDGRNYTDISAPDLTKMIVNKFPDGVTNSGQKYSDFLTGDQQEQMKVDNNRKAVGGFLDQILNAPASLVSGAEEKILGTGVFGKFAQSQAQKSEQNGIQSPFGTGVVTPPKNAMDVVSKGIETGADVLAATNPELGGWAIPGLFGASAATGALSQGKTGGQATEAGIGTGLLTFFGGKILGDIAEVAGSSLSKVLSMGSTKAISEAMGSFSEKISSLVKADPTVIANPSVISEAQSTYEGLQKGLWDEISMGGKVGDINSKAQTSMIQSAQGEINEAFRDVRGEFANPFKLAPIPLNTTSEVSFSGTLRDLGNAKAQYGGETANALPSDLEGMSDEAKAQFSEQQGSGMPSKTWQNYEDAVSPILNPDGTLKPGLTLQDVLKGKMAAESGFTASGDSISPQIQKSVEGLFRQAESDALALVKTSASPEVQSQIFNENGVTKWKEAWANAQEALKSKLTDAVNNFVNPGKFFSDVLEGLSGKGVTSEQVASFKNMFQGDNQKVFQDGLYNKLLDTLKANVDRGAFSENVSLVDNLLKNSSEIFSPAQRNAIEYGLKPMASQSFNDFLGNVGAEKTEEIAPGAVGAAQSAATNQRISGLLENTLESNDPDVLFKKLSGLTTNDLETVRSKLTSEGQEQLDSFLKQKTMENLSVATKNPITGKYNIKGMIQLADKLQGIRSGLSEESKTSLDAFTRLVETQKNLEGVSVTKFGSIITGLRKMLVAHFAGGLGEYSGITSIAKGLTGEDETVSATKYVSLMKQMLDDGKAITGDDILKFSGLKKAGMDAVSIGADLIKNLSPLVAGNVSKNSMDQDEYMRRAANLMGRQPTDEETTALQNQYAANNSSTQ